MTVPIRIREDPFRDVILLTEVQQHHNYRQMAKAIDKSLGTVQQGLQILEGHEMIMKVDKKYQLTDKGKDKLRSLGYVVIQHADTTTH